MLLTVVFAKVKLSALFYCGHGTINIFKATHDKVGTCLNQYLYYSHFFTIHMLECWDLAILDIAGCQMPMPMPTL